MSKIGKMIRELRLENKMTQSELGALLGVQKSAIQKYERGDIVNLRADKIKKLCTIFHIYPRYFIFESDDEFWNTYFDGHTQIMPMDHVVQRALEEQFGLAIFRVLASLRDLNTTGVSKVTEYIKDIYKIAEYTKSGE